MDCKIPSNDCKFKLELSNVQDGKGGCTCQWLSWQNVSTQQVDFSPSGCFRSRVTFLNPNFTFLSEARPLYLQACKTLTFRNNTHVMHTNFCASRQGHQSSTLILIIMARCVAQRTVDSQAIVDSSVFLHLLSHLPH